MKKIQKLKAICFSVGIIFIFIIGLFYFFNDSKINAANEYDGDPYVTSTKISDSSNQTITNNGIMEIDEIYELDYEWEIPDNLYQQGDTLKFSIPKEFKVVKNFRFNLYEDSEEIAQVNILGNADNGYTINMTFTTDYVETHSAVSGTFNLSYILNEKFIKVDSENTIIFPDKEIIITVPKPDDNHSGGGSGEGSGDTSNNKKVGDAIAVNLPESPDVTSTVFEWDIGLGRNILLGKVNSFEEIKHIYISDTPHDQKMVAFYDVDSYWSGSYAFEGGFFTTLPWEYGGVPQQDMNLTRDSSNSYFNGFQLDILPSVLKYENYAKENSAGFRQYLLRYYTTPIYDVIEDTEFNNDATITIVYNDSTEDSWVLSDTQIYNVAEGTITGKTAGVEFKKIDEKTETGLQNAVFDLYKENITGNYSKVKSNIVSNEEGLVRTERLTTGNYYFLETESPEGFELSNEKLNFSITTSDLNEPNQVIQYKNIGLFKNQENQQFKNISVTKSWDDKNNQDGKRPSQIQVQLYGNTEAVGAPVTLNEGNQWQYTWTELPEKANGQDIVYTVKEVNVPSGYDVSINNEDQENLLITNTYEPEVVNLKGTKTWDDKENQDGKRPERITVNLLANGEEVAQKVVTSSNQWSYEFTNLPKYEDGKEIVYTVTEDNVPDYTTEITGTEITNRYTPGETSATVTKSWDDKNNQDGKRPSQIQVQLYGNTEAVGAPVTLNEGNQWQYTWTELPEKANGQDIVYTVKEVNIPSGYDVSINNEDQGNLLITNTYEPEVVNLKGTKTWDDKENQDGKRPESITVNLLANSEEVARKVVTSSNQWSYEFTNLPKYEDGKEIVYTVTEDNVPDYTTEITGTEITNRYTPGETSATVTKSWDDKNNQDGKRPSQIQVQLYGNNEAVGAPVTLNEGNQWQYTWTELPEKANGQDIVYTVKEVNIPYGYDVSINNEDQGNLLITNTYEPEVVNLKGTKTWDDKENQDGKRPESITVNLLANGEEVAQKVVTSSNQWSYEFTNLPKYEDGKEIVYTVTEDNVPDYTTEITGTEVTNRYTPGETSATVTKSWDDKNNQDGKRPSQIQVQLYGNNEAVGAPVTLNEGNQWQYTWTELPEKANGQDIIYTVKEVNVPSGYDVSINNEDQGNLLITNTMETTTPPEPTKPNKPSQGGEKSSQNKLLNAGEKLSVRFVIFGVLVLSVFLYVFIIKKMKEV
ncbi:Cna B-type domain-containing protein [Enterococcus sp. LJL99]